MGNEPKYQLVLTEAQLDVLKRLLNEEDCDTDEVQPLVDMVNNGDYITLDQD